MSLEKKQQDEVQRDFHGDTRI
ncbi:hypothetical protein CGLO_13361 [Colletotrichum gloeosporioides Cg-14]|uniref:Uncharacterized protein n=1 Tax=Colletotrichum gloeosporioides (strain Cg-14) TaxID=1237896 RepID=T0K6A0_COLGC|nr:hypothetical protein CGLO_13361 [Colletotrichum gloeosporioides Cg-14]